MTITIEEVKRLNAERTPGNWTTVSCDNGHTDVCALIDHNANLDCVRYKRVAVTNPCNHYKDSDFIAAAPAIAQLAIDLHEENERLRNIRNSQQEHIEKQSAIIGKLIGKLKGTDGTSDGTV